MSFPASITPAVLDRILGFLTALFIDAATDPAAARNAAAATLLSHGANTDRQLRFAALSIAFGFGALDSMDRAAQPGLTDQQVLRLRANANALQRAGHQADARLETLQKAATVENQAAEDPAEPMPDDAETETMLAFMRQQVNAVMKAMPLTPGLAPDLAPDLPPESAPATLSRQQRRLMERKAEKARQRQQQEARLAERLARQRAA